VVEARKAELKPLPRTPADARIEDKPHGSVQRAIGGIIRNRRYRPGPLRSSAADRSDQNMNNLVARAPQWMRSPRLRKIALWTGGTIALVAVLGFLVAPPIVRHQLQKVLSEQLHREVTIEQVRINPFALSASVRHLAVKEHDGAANVFGFDELSVNVAYSSLWRRALLVEALKLARPYVRIVRNDDKTYNVQDLVEAFTRPAQPEPTSAPPRFALFNIEVDDGRIEFDDRPEKTRHTVDSLRIGVPFISSIPSQVDVYVHPELRAIVNGAPFALTGETKPFKDTRETTLKIDLKDLQIAQYLEYSPVPLRLRVQSGRLDTQLALSLSTQGDKLNTLVITGSAALRGVVVAADDGTRLAAVDTLQVELNALDLVGRRFNAKRVRIDKPDVLVTRFKDGRINLLGVIEPAPSAASEADDAPPVAIEVGALSIADGTVRVTDHVPARPFQTTLTNVALDTQNLAYRAGGGTGQPDPQAPAAAVKLAFEVDSKGRLAYDGTLQLGSLQTEGQLAVDGVRIAPFAPYYEDMLDVLVSNGVAATRGRLAVGLPQGRPLRVTYRGEALITGFASRDKPTSQDLLRWKSLAARGIDFDLEPLAVAVDEIALSDFYSRLIVNNDATLNLQRLIRRSNGAPAAATEPLLNEPPAAAPPAEGNAAAQTEAPQAPPSAAASSQKLRDRPNVRIGRFVLKGGRINFSDYFIKPNYSADLSAVSGTVGAMTPDSAGDVELRGRIGETAPIEILGRVNPLAGDLFLDINASAREVELSPLSPYAVKYAGYGIEKGKLSLRVRYLVENRKLAAENNLYLDQLTFGERVESPTATKLPVLLAVALLKDRNGVIDVNLPISGSLDDPQFSLGGVIARAIVNLIAKAVTAPFAWLGALAGGRGEELAYVEFAPGSARLTSESEDRLRSLAKALAERPGLKLDVSGRVDPQADRAGLKRLLLDRRVKAEKLKQAEKKTDAEAFEPEALDDVTLEPAAYAAYLTAVYRAAKFDRPRNALGMLRDLPVPEMEQLLLDNIAVTDEDLRRLANSRAQAAQVWLVETGGIPAERVFLAAAKLDAQGIKDSGKPTRVDFSLR
jgi:hypothetical protein